MVRDAIDFDWNHARSFLMTAEKGSFSSAARSLKLTQPTVGRQVAALEEELGVTLFERVGTRLKLTVSGMELLEHVRSMREAATRTSMAATRESESLSGTVSITASEVIAHFVLPPVLMALQRKHPAIFFELSASNQAEDLHRREADIALRNFAPRRPDLIARKVRNSSARFYAAPSYVERHGPLHGLQDLARADLIGYARKEVMVEQYRNYLGVEVTEAQFSMVTSNHLVMWQLCKRGAGVCLMLDEVGDEEPDVVRVFPELPSVPLPIWLVCHRELHTSRRLRVVFDGLAEALIEPS